MFCRGKCKEALMRGDKKVAEINAENAIRQHNESLNCKRMAARVHAVQARVANAAVQRQVNF